MALPTRSLTSVVTVAVYVVKYARVPDGVNVAVVPLYDTVPPIVPLPSLTINVDGVMLPASIASLNVAVITASTDTPVAPLPGLVALTSGGVVSNISHVVKLQV